MGPRIDQQFQRRSAVVEDAVDGMKDGRLPAETVAIDVGWGVDIGSCFKKNTCALDAIELRTDVQRCNAFAGCECARYSQFAIQLLPFIHETLDSRIIVQ